MIGRRNELKNEKSMGKPIVAESAGDERLKRVAIKYGITKGRAVKYKQPHKSFGFVNSSGAGFRG